MPIKVGKWLAGIWTGISKLWKNANAEVKKLAPVAIEVTQRWKLFIDSPVADFVGMLIPGHYDDILKERLRAILPAVIIHLQLAHVIADIKDPNEQLKAIMAKLRLSPDKVRDHFYHEFAYLILQSLSDGKLSMSESIVIAEYYYANIEKKKS